MKIKTVTITGADDSIHHVELLKIQDKYPFVEFGILMSKSQMGHTRFPSKKWMDELSHCAAALNLSGHLCGSWLYKNVLEYADFSFVTDLALWNFINRAQLNFHGHSVVLRDETIQALKAFPNIEFIVQMDSVNNFIYKELLNNNIKAAPLFDVSHGAGVLPSEWPETIEGVDKNSWRGYAGGLGPDNIEEQLVKLSESVGDQTVWIDMETKIRSNNDQQFDLYKVEKCLEISSKYTK